MEDAIKIIIHYVSSLGIDAWHFLTVLQIILFLSNWKSLRNWKNTSELMRFWIVGMGITTAIFIACSLIIIIIP